MLIEFKRIPVQIIVKHYPFSVKKTLPVFSKKGVEPSLHPCMKFPSIFQVQFCSKRKVYPGFIKN